MRPEQGGAVPIKLRYTGPNGETRPWTLKEMIQGKPIDRPTHVMLVHFPIAFYFGVLGLDVLSRLGTFPAGPVAATYLLLGAFAATAGAAITGLVDRSTMRPGSRSRKKANQHLTVMLITAGIFILDFAIRWGSRHHGKARLSWILLEVVGVGAVTIGADLGGQLVYKMGVRVGGN
jgi:uncharacterized membrane protein